MCAGLDGEKVARLQLGILAPTVTTPTRKRSEPNRNIAAIDQADLERRLETQKNEVWHRFVDGNLILKQGLVDKRKGLFPRKRMLLLTTGPRLYYVDPTAMVLKGEIPWSRQLTAENKNFKIFFIHTVSLQNYKVGCNSG